MSEPLPHCPLQTDRGWHFVRYPDGATSFLMSRASCCRLVGLFGGAISRHSSAPRNILLRHLRRPGGRPA